MATKRVLKSTIDWTEMAKRVPVAQKSNFIAFKSKSDGFLRKVMANPEELPKIDWSYYKANASNKAIIEQFEKTYRSLKIPYPDDKGAYSAVAAEEKEAMAKVKSFVEGSNTRIKQYEKDIECIKNALPMIEMNEEEFAFAYPEYALDPLNRPTIYPHTKDYQYTEDDIAYWRKKGFFHGPDRYHP